MRTVRTISEVRSALRDGKSPVGLVPTMGALHDGHISLIEHAARDCGEVVVSVFVNPIQFNDASDLEAYPRDERRDAELARDAGATILFAPPLSEIYPEGFSTSVQVSGPLTETLEAVQRGAAHFHGVTTVVTKLLNIVAPDIAYFGQKDAQQALVVRKLVTDLDLDIQIEVLPTVREADGLALSSRNQRLSPSERERALALIRGLEAARAAARTASDAREVRSAAVAAMAEFDVDPEYVELVNPNNFERVDRLNGSDVLVAVAAGVGDVRLIDNLLIPSSSKNSDSIGTSAHVGGWKPDRSKDS
jgi:pantoate--beta-alanine ligase